MLDLQRIAHEAEHPVPLLIAIDQENGGVNSLYDEVYIRQFPSAMGMAAAGSKKLAKDVARATAQELSSCGINWILGPVLDVLTIFFLPLTCCLNAEGTGLAASPKSAAA